jgi:hypothetical protein
LAVAPSASISVLRCRSNVVEVGRFAGETHAMFGIFLVLAPPEIGRVGDVRIRGVDGCQRAFSGTDNKGRAAGRSGIFQRVAGTALGSVHADGHGVIGHAGADESHRGNDGFGARLTGEFPVTGLDVGDSVDRLGHDCGGRFDGIRMRFRADPHGAQLVGVDLGPRQRIARRFDRHGDHVLVHAGDGFFFNGQRGLAASPDAGNLFGGDAITRHVRAVAGKADRAGGF